MRGKIEAELGSIKDLGGEKKFHEDIIQEPDDYCDECSRRSILHEGLQEKIESLRSRLSMIVRMFPFRITHLPLLFRAASYI